MGPVRASILIVAVILHTAVALRADEAAVPLEVLRQRAEAGHASDQVALGNRYAKGEGLPKDDAEAVRWFRRAAEQRFAHGEWALGTMYNSGRGVAKDEAQAQRLFLRAAEH